MMMMMMMMTTTTMASHTRFMEQAFTNPYPTMEWKCTTTEEIE